MREQRIERRPSRSDLLGRRGYTACSLWWTTYQSFFFMTSSSGMSSPSTSCTSVNSGQKRGGGVTSLPSTFSHLLRTVLARTLMTTFSKSFVYLQQRVGNR